MIVRARWLLPIDRPPIEGGWIDVQGGRIARIERGRPPSQAQDLGRVAVLPALVNAHTHLELSWLAGRVPPAESMVAWIRRLLAERASAASGSEPARTAAIGAAAASMVRTGTALVGDVSNTLTTLTVLREAGLGGVIFHEILGFDVVDARAAVREAWRRGRAAIEAQPAPVSGRPDAVPEIQVSLVAHAPYSVSPALLSEVGRRRRDDAPLAIHVGESPEEIEFLRTGRGPFRHLLEDLGVWNDAWTPPQCDPVEYLGRLGYLRPGLLAVHGVHLKEQAIERLRQTGALLVTCPRSNEWVGVGLPPLSRYYAAGIPVAVGTDSLASAPTLNVFDELAAMRRVAPDVAAPTLLESATRVGAEALGLDTLYGTLAPGKRADLVTVDVPEGVTDVEEYLVSGVPESAVRRLR